MAGKPSNAKLDTTSAAFHVGRARRLIDIKDYDGALVCFSRAYLAGMSKDSMCYFYAEAFLGKGALDTALAFNFGIKAAKNPGLVVVALKQRAEIYTALGWKKDAAQVIDSLKTFLEDLRPFYIPGIVARLGADYTNRRERQQPWYPYQDPVADTIYRGPGIGGDVAATWSIPAGKLFLLRVGVNGSETSKYYRSTNSADSVNVSAGLIAGLQHKKSRLSLDYGIARSVDYIGEYLTQNTLALSMPVFGKLWQTYVSAGYMLELEAGNRTRSQTYWLLAYFTHPRPSGDALSLSIRGSGYFAPPLVTSESFHVMYVDNVNGSPVHHFAINSQTQSPTSDTITGYYMQLPQSYESNSIVKTGAALFSIPQNFVFTQNQMSISPLVEYKQPLILGLNADIGVQATVSYFPDKYLWATFNVGQTMLDTAPHDANMNYYLAFNEADGKYYWVKDLSNATSGEQYVGPVEAGRQYQKRRVDAEISGFMSVSRPVWKLGTVSLRFDCTKTYSTLRSERFLWWRVSDVDAPFPIPDWFYGLSVTWSFAFPARQ